MKCESCGVEVQLPFHCGFCGSYFCQEHRLPEAHCCSGLPSRVGLGSSQSRKEMAILRDLSKEKASATALRLDADTSKRELPSFTFNRKSRKKTGLRVPKKRRVR